MATPAQENQPVRAAMATPAQENQPVRAAMATPAQENQPATAAMATPAKDSEPAKAAKATPAKRTARKAATKATPRSTPAKTAAPVQRQPVPPAAETETVALPGAEPAPTVEVVPTRPPTLEPPAATPAEAEANAAAQAPAQARESAAQPRAEAPAPPHTEAWAKIVADPGHAPELLALAAVQTIGPRAKDWARRTRDDYPAATRDAVARLAVAQFTRVGSLGSVFAAVAGSYAPITLLGANAFTYAELLLHVAAAYDLDPTEPRRAVELLVLTRVHPTAEAAEAALASARQPAYEEDARFTDAVRRFGRTAAAQATAWTVLKGINRFFPGTTVLAAILTSSSGTNMMGARAIRFYSQENQRSGSRV